MLNLIMLFSFISLSMIIYQLLKYYAGRQKSIYRLKKYIYMEELREEKTKQSRKEFKAGLYVLAKGIGQLRFLDGYKKSVQFKLNRAHILLKAEEFITIRMIVFVTAGSLSALAGGSVFISAAVAAAGWFIPEMILKSQIKKRVKNINDQLGDAIVLISNSLKAGYSFFQAADIVAKEMPPPISEEFALLQKEINLGATTEKALENLIYRVGSDDLELVVTAVMIQRQTGGNLSEVLDNISCTIRDRVRIKGEVRTLTAQGRLSGLIISLLPPVLGFIIYLINPEHISLLFTNPLGMAILAFSALMELIGIYFVNRIVRIEV
jgi:tight adherence protein B